MPLSEIARHTHRPHPSRAPTALLAVASLLAVLVLSPGCLTSDNNGSDADTITLYGFSVKGEALESTIIPAFQELWKNQTGKDVKFKTVFGGSGTITNQVIAGAPAEVMLLSTEWDAMQLRKEGLVSTDWNTLPHNGTVTLSPWVILTRQGNPEHLLDFPDLERDGIEVVHPDPLTSGGARWSVFAVYGSVIMKSMIAGQGPDIIGAERLLEGVVDNVISWPSSARNALSQFDLGYGDALITYECEALLARGEGKSYNISYPESTIMSEHKVVIVDKNVGSAERGVVDAFVQYLFSEEAQEAFVDHGFRPVNATVGMAHPELPTIAHPFTVALLGGWEKAQGEVIDGVFTRIKG